MLGWIIHRWVDWSGYIVCVLQPVYCFGSLGLSCGYAKYAKLIGFQIAFCIHSPIMIPDISSHKLFEPRSHCLPDQE